LVGLDNHVWIMKLRNAWSGMEMPFVYRLRRS